jgi:mitochondrial cardiolipin hydrolase
VAAGRGASVWAAESRGGTREEESASGVTQANEVIFTRSQSGAETLERLIASAAESIVVALYRLSNFRLAEALHAARLKGASVRLCLNHNDHYDENREAQSTLARYGIHVRVAAGRHIKGSKMHHKFAVFDRRIVATGSYSWTRESEELNYENLVVLREPFIAAEFAREFEALWSEGSEPSAAV